MNQPKTRTGSCLCGAVAFETTGGLKDVVHCHCTDCRKQAGQALAFTAAWKDQFCFTEERGLKWYRSSDSSRRGFCGECGSVLFFDTDGDEKISVAAGAFDGETGLVTAAHIWVDSKGDYYNINDGTPQLPRSGDKVPMPPRH